MAQTRLRIPSGVKPSHVIVFISLDCDPASHAVFCHAEMKYYSNIAQF